jgi:predicted NAD/FAD-dependent oxidoreductase
MSRRPKVAIIGAGVAGLSAARRLCASAETVLFEKSRGPGGRLAHRRAEPFGFDFGAQFITARDPVFRAEIERLAAAGIVAPWRCRFVEIERDRIVSARHWDEEKPHFVGVGRMTSLAAAWAAGLDLRRTIHISALHPQAKGWRLLDKDGSDHGPFDFLILAIPAAQAADLLPPGTPLKGFAQNTRMKGCFALMLGFDELPDLGYDAAMIRQSPLSWLSVSRSRPGQEGGAGLLLLSDNDWADRHIEEPPDDIVLRLHEALHALVGELGAPRHSDLHRWRYANCDRQVGPASLIDADNRLGLCGDWTSHGRVEAAFLSGVQVAEQFLALQDPASTFSLPPLSLTPQE